MARTRTLLELRTEARQRAVMPNANFVSNSELTRYIDESYTRFRALISIDNDHDFYLADPPQSISTASGTASYSLASDFVALKSVDVDLGLPSLISILPYNQAERNRYNIDGRGWNGFEPIRYRLFAGKIKFVPTPTAVHTVTVEYLPTHTVLSGDSDTVDGINGWEEWIIIDAALKCMDKQTLSHAQLEARKARIEEEIVRESSARDLSFPQQIQDVTGRWHGNRGY